MKTAKKASSRSSLKRRVNHDQKPVNLSLCVIFRDNADTIDNLIQSVRGHFDEYVFVDTGSKDGTRARIESAGLPNLVIRDFEWCDDFSAARQVSFDAARGRWRMFLDTDDVLVGGEGLRRLLSELDEKNPEIKGIFVPYVYAADEQLNTMRIAKFDGPWRWADKIHERLEREGLKQANFAATRAQEIRVLHKDKSPEEKRQAIDRNAVIARREYEGSADPRYRARLARTIAMEMKAADRQNDAIPYLEEVYRSYTLYPEGRHAAADLTSIYIGLAYAKDAREPDRELLDTALMWSKRAGPAYEALAHHARKEWAECLRAAQRSQPIPQQTTHEGWVPEKGGVPAAAAEARLALGAPDAADAADAILGSIPRQLRLHPLVLPHIMRLRSQIDRITILVPNTPQPFDENGGGGMLGGSEEAVMYLTRELARLGRNVRVYAPLPIGRLPGRDRFGVDWQQVSSFAADGEHGVLVVWRAPGVITELIRGAVQSGGVYPGIVGSLLWLHDGLLGVDSETADKITYAIDGAVVLSDFHARQIAAQGLGKLIRLSNGIVREDFEADIGRWEKDPMSVVYSSCPSRGLRSLLSIWPEVKAKVPAAKLDIYYDWSMIQAAQPEWYEGLVADMEKVKGLDVVHHGGVNHERLHAALKKANVWAYSHFENTTVETFCISAVKATACGAVVLTAPNGALPEVAPFAHFRPDLASYRDALVELLTAPIPMEEREDLARDSLRRFAWDEVAKRFSEVWSMRFCESSARERAGQK